MILFQLAVSQFVFSCPFFDNKLGKVEVTSRSAVIAVSPLVSLNFIHLALLLAHTIHVTFVDNQLK